MSMLKVGEMAMVIYTLRAECGYPMMVNSGGVQILIVCLPVKRKTDMENGGN